MRIAAAGARLALGQPEAAVVTLTCDELNERDASWSYRLQIAYLKALEAAGNSIELEKLKKRFPHLSELLP
jgi:hypothetical protein